MHLEGRTLSATDAEWILGFYLHHNVEGHFVPGLLDGLLRHWDLHRCSPLARDVAATGRLPGWAVLAGKGMKTGEEVFLCSEQPNGQLWAMYGIIYPENPHGAALTQGTISDSLLDAMLQQAQLTCRRSEDLLSASNLRCASVLWLGGGEAAFHALQAGYFDSWPRPPGATFAVWREAEGRLYRQLVKECNSSKMVLSTVDAATLEEVKQDRSQVSKSALLVRDPWRTGGGAGNWKQGFFAMRHAGRNQRFLGADPELTVQLVATAEQSGWQEQKNRAVELVQRRLLESARALKASSDEAISGVRFLARAFSEAEKAKCSVEASLKDALNQLEGSGDELWLKKWDAGPEHAPKDAEKAAEEAQKLDAKEIGEKIQAKLNADAIFKAATDAPADAEKALKAYEQSAKRSENLRKQALKMLTRTLEEAKQSGDAWIAEI
eukprot:g2951.t1